MSAAGGDESVEEYEEVDALDDSDDDFAYEEVDIEDIEDDDLLAGDDEDLETAMRSLQGLGVPLVGANTTMKPEPNAGEVTKRPEVRASPGRTSTTRLFPNLDREVAFCSRGRLKAPSNEALNAVTAPNGLELRGRGHASVRTRRTRPMSRAR